MRGCRRAWPQERGRPAARRAWCTIGTRSRIAPGFTSSQGGTRGLAEAPGFTCFCSWGAPAEGCDSAESEALPPAVPLPASARSLGYAIPTRAECHASALAEPPERGGAASAACSSRSAPGPNDISSAKLGRTQSCSTPAPPRSALRLPPQRIRRLGSIASAVAGARARSSHAREVLLAGAQARQPDKAADLTFEAACGGPTSPALSITFRPRPHRTYLLGKNGSTATKAPAPGRPGHIADVGVWCATATAWTGPERPWPDCPTAGAGAAVE